MSSYGYYYGYPYKSTSPSLSPPHPPPSSPPPEPPLPPISTVIYTEDPYGYGIPPPPFSITNPPSSPPFSLPIYASPPPPKPSPPPPKPSPPPPVPLSPPPPSEQSPPPPLIPVSSPPPSQPPSQQPAPPPPSPANYSPPPPSPTFPATPPPHLRPSPPPATKATHSVPKATRAPPLNPRSPPAIVATASPSSFAGSKAAETMTVASAVIVTGVVVLSLVGAFVWSVKKNRRPVVGYAMENPLPSNHASSLTSAASETSYTRSPGNPFLLRHGSRRLTVLSSLSECSFGSSQFWFTYEELSDITNGFSNQNLLGEGGFGSVYRGSLPDGREVAVKKLKDGGMQGEREFKAEVEIISRVHHRHLVSLVGYCISENERLLVYDYVPNNTLYYHLHGGGREVMDWATRVKVAAGAARGIAYLHEDCHPRIIHRDIKTSNILLDSNSEAQVSDFGLARLTLDAGTHVTTRVMGTFGYLAPEYASTGKLTAKSDVYSFGVVLLELITGRKPVDMSQPLGDESLVEWARPLLIHALESGSIEGLPDPKLENNYMRSEMLCLIEAAASCVRHSASMRPRMSQVARALDSLCELDLQNGVRPGQSEFFNSPLHSMEIRHFQRMQHGSSEDMSYQSQSGGRSPLYFP